MINKDPSKLKAVIDLFHQLNIDNKIVLIGSWSEMFYEGILSDFEANIRTSDIDIYYHDFKNPKISLNFIREMEKLGFYIEEQTFPAKSKFLSEELEVEFITRTSRTLEYSEKVEALNIFATCLADCEMFGNANNIMECYSEKYDIRISVPTPVAYCMHKILIHNERKPEKKEKDKISIYRFFPYIENNEELKRDWNRIYNSLSKKQKRKFLSNLKTLDLDGRIELNL